jgi:hypothetical protein
MNTFDVSIAGWCLCLNVIMYYVPGNLAAQIQTILIQTRILAFPYDSRELAVQA